MTISKKAVVSLIDDEGKIIAQEEGETPLPLIDQLLKKTQIQLEEIDEISSHPGPGSFTGLRVGAAVAQAINFALGRKVEPPKLRYETAKAQNIKKAPTKSR